MHLSRAVDGGDDFGVAHLEQRRPAQTKQSDQKVNTSPPPEPRSNSSSRFPGCERRRFTHPSARATTPTSPLSCRICANDHHRVRLSGAREQYDGGGTGKGKKGASPRWGGGRRRGSR
jgi:hypothetical protein